MVFWGIPRICKDSGAARPPLRASMNTLLKLTLIAATAAPVVAAAQDAPAPTGRYLDGVIAIVNEGVVLRSELERQLVSIRRRAIDMDMQLPPDDILQEQILERLIVEEIQLQRAERVGIQISDQMLNQALARLAAEQNVPFERLPETLASEGLSYADFRIEMRRQMTIDQLRRIEVIGGISVSPRDIDQCLADLDSNVVVNSEYNLSHILIGVPDSATGAQYAEAEELANSVYEQIVAGADFAEMAVRHSSSQTSLEGGALGWLKGDELPSLFFDVVDKLESGTISRPIRNVSGFHLVRINDLRSANQRSEIEQSNVRHILISPNEIIDDATARQRLQDAAEDIRSGDADFAELARLLSDDPGSVNDGGEMGWTSPGTFVPEFEKVMKEATIGKVTDPFRTQFGWHILEVLGRRTYDNTEDLRRNSCMSRIRAGKMANETELWVRRLRDEAYVETRI